ncbi:SDR family NAD(P)-dependent oxidoreductase [Geodermatophilus sp. URMC 62]|uniref:SDR family NAD(P)-dependent oxidoreductase n=1 Tax=Geodermatophilus sp. URMC 62 TaxID=3423414 RepID=UPI00406C66A8
MTTNYHVATGRFEGRSALVTGGANGLGYACAARMAAEGATVGLIDLKQDAVDSAVKRLQEQGHTAFGYAADVTDEAAIKAATADFNTQAGSVDVLVTMAGIFPWVDFAEMTLEQWRQVVDVNLGGTFTAAHAAMPFMKQQQYGRIVTISSGTVMLGLPGQSAYIASKNGIIGFTRVLAREGGPHGVTANCVLPGLIATEHVLTMREDTDEFIGQTVAFQCVPRRGEPADIADAVAYLGSEGSAFVTGQQLYVGGGDRFV